MIARLTGKVVEREEKALIVEAHGVGYRVGVLGRLSEKAKVDSVIALRIHHHVTESVEALYGFEVREDLKYFEMLLKVPSVGPRTAMGILEIAPPRVLEQAVAEQDTALLTKVSGVGKRTAERILVELKEKIEKPRSRAMLGSLQQETIEVLVSLGYKPVQARSVVGRLPKGITTVEEAVKAALQVSVK